MLLHVRGRLKCGRHTAIVGVARREPDDDFGVFVVVVERPIVWRRRLGGVDGERRGRVR
jgi:hypothetical protein